MDYHPIPAIFVADTPGLDFLNSVATPVDEPVDWISDGEGLLDWMAQTGMAPHDALADIRASSTPEELDEIAAQARALREWFRAYVKSRKGHALSADDLRDLEPLNQLLARDAQHGEIVASESG